MVPRRSQVDPLAASIGARVRSLRQANGLTLAKLAAESGLASKGHLSDLEHGRLVPTVGTLQALATKLGVELLDLLIIPDKNPRHRLIAQSSGLPDPVLLRWLTEAEELPVRPGPSRLMPVKKAPKAATPKAATPKATTKKTPAKKAPSTTTTKKAPPHASRRPSTRRVP